MSNTPTRLAILCAPRAQQFCEPLNQFRHLEPLAQCACGPAFHALTVDRRTGEVLGVKRGIGDLVEGRASSINLADWENVYREFRLLEPGIEGGRVVRNLISFSEDLTRLSNYGTPVSVETSSDVPDSSFSLSTKIVSDAVFEGKAEVIPLVVGATYTFSIYAKGEIGGEDIYFTDGLGAGGLVTITNQWKRYSITVAATRSDAAVLIADPGDTVYFTGYQVENVSGQSNQNPGEYVSVGVGTIDIFTDPSELPNPSIVDFGGSVGAWDAGTQTMSNGATGSDNGFPRFAFNLSSFGVVVGKVYEVQGSLSGDIDGLYAACSIRMATTGCTAQISYDETTGIISGTATAELAGIQFLLDGTEGPNSVVIESLLIKDCRHGLGVDAVKVFATKNGNTVAANVVTEAMGDWLPELPWLVHAPAATNKCIYSNEFSLWGAANVALSSIDNLLIPGVDASRLTGDGVINQQISLDTDQALGGIGTATFYLKNIDSIITNISLYDNTAASWILRANITWSGPSIAIEYGAGTVSIEETAIFGIYKVTIGVTPGTPANILRIFVYPTGRGNTETTAIDLYHVQYENSAFATQPISASGAPASRLICDLGFDDENHRSEGGLDCEVQFPLASADMSGDLEISSLNGGPGLLYYDVAAGAFKSSDGTNTAEKAQVIDAGVTYKGSVRHEEGVLRVGVDDNWGTEQPYEGAFPSGSALTLFRALPYVGKIRDIRMYQGDN